MQFDLFVHSEDVLKRNAVVNALQAHDMSAMRLAIGQLRAMFPGDEALALFEGVFSAISRLEHVAPSSAGIAEAVLLIETALRPSLGKLLGESGAWRWLIPLHARLAEMASPLPFLRRYAEAHAAPLFMKAGQLAPARAAVESIASWRQIPEPLAMMTEIALRENKAEEFWPMLAELAWIAPPLLKKLVYELRAILPPVVQRCLREFDTEFCADSVAEQQVDEMAWFPAWLLVEHGELLPVLRLAQSNDSPPARSAVLLVNLLLEERQGVRSTERRQQLRTLSPTLFRNYMARR